MKTSELSSPANCQDVALALRCESGRQLLNLSIRAIDQVGKSEWILLKRDRILLFIKKIVTAIDIIAGNKFRFESVEFCLFGRVDSHLKGCVLPKCA